MGIRLNEKTKKFLRRFGWAGFLFFLIKGLIWLAAGSAIIKWLTD
ncbi:MAG: hypothetical protein R2794_04530 [Chitinophagales bacterium]